MINRNEIELTINKYDQLISPNFHDGAVMGVRLLSANSCDIFVRTETGEDYRITLTGVACLRVTNFLLGNIIFDIAIRQGAGYSEQTLSSLYGLHSGRERDRSFLSKLMDKVRLEEPRLVEINSSIGCELTALCDQIAISC